MNGIELIAQEREEQLTKHLRTVTDDVELNNEEQLSKAASILLYNHDNCLDKDGIIEDHCPQGWDKEIWSRMVNKTYKDRLIISGALIAAELDRINHLG